MSVLSDSQTSLTLMERLRQFPRNAEAWERFVELYRPKIYGWCRVWGLQEADAEDVAQDVIAKLTQKMTHFDYDRTRCFRAWLKTITQHALSDLLASRCRALGDGPAPIHSSIEVARTWKNASKSSLTANCSTWRSHACGNVLPRQPGTHSA